MEQAALRKTAPPRHAHRFFSYVAMIVVGATVAVVAALILGDPARDRGVPGAFGSLAFWLMAAMAAVADTRPFVPPVRRATMQVFPSTCLTFAVLLNWGFVPAVLVQTTAVVLSALWLRHRPWRAAFNAGQYVLAFAAASVTLFLADLPAGRQIDGRMVLGIVAATAAWFIVNNALVATAIWLRFGGRWSQVLGSAVAFDVIATGALLLLAPVLAAAAVTSAWLVPAVFLPLYAVRRMSSLADEQAKAARLDPLTGLANRKALERETARQIAEHAELAADGAAERRVALLLLDLDGFKQVNDALGHRVGDRLLIEVGRRLRGVVRDEDLVARLGGDEFAVVVPGLSEVGGARRHAAALASALAEPVLLDGLPLDVGGSIGVAVYPEHGADFATLMQHADVAMYDAKDRGDNMAIYAPESDHNSPERLGLLADLRHALETPGDDGIALYYQPQVEISSGAVVGVEALLRWRHPDRGLVDPGELIKVAEYSMVMRMLTLRVVDEVIAQLAAWGPAADELRVAVNVSVRDLHTGELADRITARLREHGVRPDQLELEITEGALMADPRRVLATLARLKRLGVAIALDDFGTGYSSMLHLRRLPLSEVKIDRSFVLGAATDPDDAAIVRSMIDLARALGLRVVAEGVEDERTWRMLAAAGCDVAQGWFFARPMPAEQFVNWLSRRRAQVAPSAVLGSQ